MNQGVDRREDLSQNGMNVRVVVDQEDSVALRRSSELLTHERRLPRVYCSLGAETTIALPATAEGAVGDCGLHSSRLKPGEERRVGGRRRERRSTVATL